MSKVNNNLGFLKTVQQILIFVALMLILFGLLSIFLVELYTVGAYIIEKIVFLSLFFLASLFIFIYFVIVKPLKNRKGGKLLNIWVILLVLPCLMLSGYTSMMFIQDYISGPLERV